MEKNKTMHQEIKKQENKTAQLEANINNLEKEESRIENSTESQAHNLGDAGLILSCGRLGESEKVKGVSKLKECPSWKSSRKIGGNSSNQET